jgi:hypothetical protein
MSSSLEAATGHPCNSSEVAIAIIASISVAVDALSLPQAPLIINIPAHHPNDVNPRLRAATTPSSTLPYLTDASINIYPL